jgi:hypothetical protein
MNRFVGQVNWLIVIVGGLLLVSAVGCQNKDAPPEGIDGTYVLERRDLPNGKTVRSPDVVGMMTFKGGLRNFNVFWKDGGAPASIATISQYWFNEHQYTEEAIYYMENLPGGAGPKYVTTPERASSQVTQMDRSWQFKLPLHGEPEVVFTKDGFTATRGGAFVDHWRKVE